MAWDAWSLVARDVQIALVANLLGPIIYLYFPSLLVSALTTLVLTGVVALFANWAPASVVTSLFVLLPFLPWGIAEGFLISSANDHFTPAPSPLDQQQPHVPTIPQAARLVTLGLVIVICAAQIINVAVPHASLSFVLWITTGMMIVGHTGIWLLHRMHAQYKVAWLTMGIIATGANLVVTLAVWLSESLFWSLITLLIYWPVAMIATYLSSVFTSADVMHAARGIVSGTGAHGMPVSPASAPLSPVTTPMPSLSSSSSNISSSAHSVFDGLEVARNPLGSGGVPATTSPHPYRPNPFI